MNDVTQAFGISEEDVENVINAARRWEKTILPARDEMRQAARLIPIAGLGIPNLSLSELAAALFERLDHNAVAGAALEAGTEMDDQTDAAYIEIERQLNELDPRILTTGYLPSDDERNQLGGVPTPDAFKAVISSELLQLAEQASHLFGRPGDVDLTRKMMTEVAKAFAASPEGRAAIAEQDVEAGYRSDAQVARVLSGVHPVAGGFNDAPFVGCPESFGEKNFANIVWHEDKGDPDVGIPTTSGWTLGPNQSGTVVADLAAMQRQVDACADGAGFETGCPSFDKRQAHPQGTRENNSRFVGRNESAAAWMLENFDAVVKRAVLHGATAAAKQIEQMRLALSAAESFIAGFEGNPSQEGIGELIEQVRTAQEPGLTPAAGDDLNAPAGGDAQPRRDAPRT